ncbi:hypothetical protein AgCh_033092 [Apium graveolens]
MGEHLDFPAWLKDRLTGQAWLKDRLTGTGDGALFWAKPHFDEVKILVDAAVFEDQGKSGIGLIARNHDGYLLTTKIRTFEEVMNPSLVEAIAIKEALSWAKDVGWNSVIIESDCLVVVQMIRSAAPLRSRIGQVIEECRQLVRDFNNFKLYFVKRSANVLSHELARFGLMTRPRFGPTFDSFCVIYVS